MTLIAITAQQIERIFIKWREDYTAGLNLDLPFVVDPRQCAKIFLKDLEALKRRSTRKP